MSRVCLTICLSLFLFCHIGCAPAKDGAVPAAKIKGEIKMDGQPIPSGEIHFGMAGVPPKVLQITNGAFEGEAPIGKNKVEVFILVDGPPSEKYPGVTTKKNIAPEKYWGAQSTLEATVSASGTEPIKFDITSK